jgi:hypothetical protein
MRRLRDRLNRIETPTEAETTQAARAIGPTDGNPNGRLTSALLSVLPKALQPEGAQKEAAPLLPDVRPSLPPQRSPAVASAPQRSPARPANAAPKAAQNQAKAPNRPAARPGVDAPRDPPAAPVVGR